MADDQEGKCEASMDVFQELESLVWGPNVKEEVFQRWTQGFIFSPDEPTALVQEQGGPCAVIAAVQAYMLKNILFCDGSDASSTHWKHLSDDQTKNILVSTLWQMLQMTLQEEGHKISVALLKDHMLSNLKEENSIETDDGTSTCHNSESPQYHKSVCEQELKHQSYKEINNSISIDTVFTEAGKLGNLEKNLLKHMKEPTNSSTHIQHSAQQVQFNSSSEARTLIERNIHIFEGHFGVLLFLYSMILTRGIHTIKDEMGDPGEPLVDENFGYGSQTLINLLMTGQAVSNVWNLSKEISGLELKGIAKQSQVGFLTLLEAHRYCEVGSFLKCPIYPIWLLGSETHITVLFSTNQSLSGLESPKQEAQRVFKSFDEQENGFIESDKLTDVLCKLELETDPEYVTFMKSRLDPDSIGIILLPNFMEEFFPGESMSPQWTGPFTVYHYNGLGVKQSDCQLPRKVMYTEGIACIEPTDLSHIAEEEIISCLKTKWRGLTVTWHSKYPPSVN